MRYKHKKVQSSFILFFFFHSYLPELSHWCSLVEDYCPGYPRYSALLGAHDSFPIFRRFTNIRARLLLLKRDKSSLLEKQLEKVDSEEAAVLSLGGSSRCDTNQERGLILSDIDCALADYGTRYGSLRAKFTSANTCQ